MANSSVSAAFMESQCVIQPRRLKDFLQDQNLPFPRPRKSTISVFIHAAVSSVKSSSILRRSISRRFSKSTRSNKNGSSGGLPEATMARSTSVTVKDILRWKSFRDLADLEENNVPRPSDFTVESPSRCTATTTATTTTSAGTPRSSWCDSDFTVGDSPVWCRGFSGDIEVADKKNFHINVASGDRIRQNTRDPKDHIVREEEEEQFSPISVLDFAQEHEETFSSFHQILANMDRRNFMLKQQIQEFENLIVAEDHSLVNKNIELDDVESFIVEEKAIELMNQVKTTTSIEESNSNMDYLLLDFFRDELFTKKGLETDSEFESRVLRVAKSWIRGESDESLEWEIEGTREMCVREIEKIINLKDFKEDKQEIGIEIASMVFDHLLDELSSDLVNI
ncbi:uncharacterized protein LOC112526672 [Cynara cardunculus var. scolymus]|uniref:DUF4378 domain-containing protein n=1 Tax=Cynara cardunculus var. scolymus TaxID=59895 RepID=A0A103XE95_CYNCS|nr:uncharacterized protein LOC112526672 [Cynara cardunculus var. scolymus]KVH89134.1 hypothetical protein Ccrd_008875 [Cynara cardunculus var. scolymus]